MKRQTKRAFGALPLAGAIAAGPAGTASAIEFLNGPAVADRIVALADVPGGGSARGRRAETYHKAETQAGAGRKGRWAKMP